MTIKSGLRGKKEEGVTMGMWVRVQKKKDEAPAKQNLVPRNRLPLSPYFRTFDRTCGRKGLFGSQITGHNLGTVKAVGT